MVLENVRDLEQSQISNPGSISSQLSQMESRFTDAWRRSSRAALFKAGSPQLSFHSRQQIRQAGQSPDPLLNGKIFLLIISSLRAEHKFIETGHDVLLNLIHYLLHFLRRHWNT